MNTDAILSLIADLYMEIGVLRQQNAALQEALAERAQSEHAEPTTAA